MANAYLIFVKACCLQCGIILNIVIVEFDNSFSSVSISIPISARNCVKYTKYCLQAVLTDSVNWKYVINDSLSEASSKLYILKSK
jgi:hypothetical protein